MNLAEKIALVSIAYSQDDLGEWIETRTENEVFARVESISMSEFYQAGMQGLDPDYKLVIWMQEYGGEELVSYNGKTYAVYRTYRRDDGRIELYVSEKKGDEEDDTEEP